MKLNSNYRVQELANAVQLKISDSGHAFLDSAWKQNAVCSPFSRLYYIAAGYGELSQNGQKTILSAGSLYLIPAGIVFDYCCPDYLEQLYFHINLFLPNGLDLFQGYPHILSLPDASGRFSQLSGLYQKMQLPDILELHSVISYDLSRFLRLLPEHYFDIFRQMDSEFPRSVFDLALHPISAATTVRRIAARLHLSESSLNRRFRQAMGISLGTYLDQILLNASSKMLLSTDLSIAEISERLNFCDQFYFSRYFRQHYGEPPSWYRKRLKALP